MNEIFRHIYCLYSCIWRDLVFCNNSWLAIFSIMFFSDRMMNNKSTVMERHTIPSDIINYLPIWVTCLMLLIPSWFNTCTMYNKNTLLLNNTFLYITHFYRHFEIFLLTHILSTHSSNTCNFLRSKHILVFCKSVCVL